MLTLYYWPTPNGHKVVIFLEETGLAYRLLPVDIGRGEQFAADFLRIAPNNRIPAIVDDAPASGGAPVSLFESGAILLYLAEKTGRFLPTARADYYTVVQWLMWQMGGLGPMLGQNHHFRGYAPEQIPYAVSRYEKEARRLYAVLDKQLHGRNYICGDYSIADMACYPWTVPYERQGIVLDDYPQVRRWHERLAARPAVARAYQKGAAINTRPTVDEAAKKFLFGQTAPACPVNE